MRLSYLAFAISGIGCGAGSHPAGPGDAAAHDAPHRVDAASADSNRSDAGSAAGSVGPYGANGSAAFTMTTATVTGGASSSFTAVLYVPSTPGPHPVVVLSSGLEQTAAGYASYGERLASWGIIAVLRDDPGFLIQTSTIVDDVVFEVGTWLPAENAGSGALAGMVDASKVGLAGHSRGGQVSLLAAEGGAQGLVTGMFGLDPVDGTSAPEAITSIGSIATPIAFIGETTDDASSGCAPSAQNFLALYGAASSPAVALTAIGADHTMFEDPANCSFCELCTAGTATQSVVEGEAERYLMAFFARELLGDTSVGAAFQGAGVDEDAAAGLVTVVSK